LGKRFNNSSEGANSWAWPGTNTKSMSRPAVSQTPTILLPNPPLERPSRLLKKPAQNRKSRVSGSDFRS